MSTYNPSVRNTSLKCSVFTIGNNLITSMDVLKVSVPVQCGCMTIYKDHIPYISDIHFGELTIYDNSDKTIRLYVEDGIVEVSKNNVSILVKRAFFDYELNEEDIIKKIRSIEDKELKTKEDINRKNRAIRRLKYQLKMIKSV